MQQNYIDIEIDKLTNSIENAITGEVFDTVISIMQIAELKRLKKVDWVFDWTKEGKDDTKLVFKLTTINNPEVVHGLISLQDKEDHIFMHLIEVAKFNKGRNKSYFGVPGNLVAFACKLSFDKGYQGYVVFDAKTSLIRHYKESLGATHFRGLRMFLETSAAFKLVKQYFKN